MMIESIHKNVKQYLDSMPIPFSVEIDYYGMSPSILIQWDVGYIREREDEDDHNCMDVHTLCNVLFEVCTMIQSQNPFDIEEGIYDIEDGIYRIHILGEENVH